MAIPWGTIGKVAEYAVGLLGGFSGSSNASGFSLADTKRLTDYNIEKNKEYTQWLNENSYSQMRLGLENAGYNPLMALGATPQQGSVGVNPINSGSTASFNGQEAFNALAQIAALKKLEAETDATRLGPIGNMINTWFGDGSSTAKKLKGKFSDFINDILDRAKEDDGSGHILDKIGRETATVLKGYVSNTANSEPFEEFNPDADLSPIPRKYR